MSVLALAETGCWKWDAESLLLRFDAGDDDGESVWTRFMTAERAELRTGKPHLRLGWEAAAVDGERFGWLPGCRKGMF